MNKLLVEHYKCPQEVECFQLAGRLRDKSGYFRLDNATIEFGRLTTSSPSHTVDSDLPDLTEELKIHDTKCTLPFEPDEIVTNLRYERYVHAGALPNAGLRRLARNGYYALRPILPFPVRAALKRFLHRGWEQKSLSLMAARSNGRSHVREAYDARDELSGVGTRSLHLVLAEGILQLRNHDPRRRDGRWN